VSPPLSLPQPPSGPLGPNQQIAYNCDKVHPAAAAPGSPPDDIRGVRLGMPPMVVEAELVCGNPAYAIARDQGGAFDVPRLNEDPQPHTSISADDGQGDKVEVLLLGMPGQEVAAHLSRSLGYALSEQPPVETERQSLIAKYGPPTSDDRFPYAETLNWIYEPSGRAMSPKNPNYDNCKQIGGYGGSFNYSKACGLTIRAAMTITGNGGVSGVDFGIMNQAAAYDAAQKEKAAINLANTPKGEAKPL
jgi:hypothetical protein